MRGSMTRTRIDPRTNGSKKAKTVQRSQMPEEDARVSRAIFTVREAAGYLGIPTSTLQRWARGADDEPLITTFDAKGHEATVPFIGFAEAYVLSAFRKAGVPMQRIRPAIEALTSTIGVDHALASQKLYTDGAEVLFDYATKEREDELIELTVVRTGQRQFTSVVKDYLKRIKYGSDGWAEQVRLPIYEHVDVVVDPDRAFGLPIVVHGGARVEDLVGRFQAGDSIADIADDFGVKSAAVEDVIRVATRAAAAT
ncbi:MAG: hypothetical protein QOJ29_1551, partial [Thermoleophilaceae bacterium]|nr:hypothetical protein [Thermoleophilaceae bacterium]